MNTTEQEPASPQSETSGIFETPQNHKLILCLILVLATLALYNPVTHAPFLNFDDSVYVTENQQVRAGLSWKTVVWAFHTPDVLDWHPLTWISHALDCQLFGLNPAGPHIVNLLIHAASAVILFLILATATGLAWRSLAVAMLFALHPINVESVAWISERKNVLSMFFFLVALAAYGWYARRPGIRRYLAVTVAYALALMSKVQVIAFPCALLLLDYWPLRRFEGGCAPSERIGEQPAGAPTRGPAWWSLVLEKVPWLAMSVAGAMLTLGTGRGFSYETVDASPIPVWLRLANATISYARYVGKILWPVNLALVYPHPEFRINLAAAALSLVAISVVSILAIIYRERRPFFVGWFWFLGTMVPMTGVVTIGHHAMADRYAYIPALGIFIILCWSAADLIASLTKDFRIPAPIVASGAIVVVLALGIALHRQVSFWGDNVALWKHTLEVTGENFAAEENLAAALIAEGKLDAAGPHLQRGSLLRPSDPLATVNLASYRQTQGDYQAAVDAYARVVHSSKTAPFLLALAEANSGYANLSLKRYSEAKQNFEAALQQQPENAMAYRGLGLLAQKTGDVSQATQHYERSAQLQPTPVSYLLLAQALDIEGQLEAARAAESQAARMAQSLDAERAAVKRLLAD